MVLGSRKFRGSAPACLGTSDRDLNLDLPVISSLVYCESSTLDHAAKGAMTRRRMSCPQTTHKLWDAIKIIRYQRQIPDQIRISRYMSRAHQTSEEDVSRHLGHCVRDNLVRLVKRVGFKGSQTGKKQESYRLPQGTVKKDNHDWYCFECHGGGDVICCTGCHRVYHLSCVATDLSEEDVKKTFVCSVCKMCKESDKFKISRRELNHLLGFTCSRLKERWKETFLTLMKKYEIIQEFDEKKITKTEIVQKSTLFIILKMREEIVNSMQKEGHYVKAKNLKDAMHAILEQAMLEWFSQHRAQNLPVVITERQVPSKQLYISDRAASSTAALQRRSDPSLGIKWVTDDEDAWRVNYLIYQPMDLHTMDCKAQNKKYRTLEEFQADAQTIVHNVVIYHGVNSSLADMARQMLRDCIYDLQEIRQCRDCYRMSNEKEDKHWFCQPCKPQHELVYAKQKGFPYWPAKVIKIEGQMYDVRFFGGHHQRAVLDKIYIRPISVNIHTLQETEESIPKLVNESTTVRVPSNDDEDDDEDDDDDEEEEEEQENCAEKKQSHEITPEDDEPISSSSKNIKDSREVALHVSHSSLMSSNRMKPRGSDSTFVWKESGKPPQFARASSNLDLSVLGNQAQHKSNMLANCATEAFC
uniref:Zinc finger MYND domain-containing protein 11 n=1 Tax=Timema douglasi TaxID=61478 RepID=A0A7R8Z930_TIMDO|nr:unnamed protein product [Timema douglasi]